MVKKKTGIKNGTPVFVNSKRKKKPTLSGPSYPCLDGWKSEKKIGEKISSLGVFVASLIYLFIYLKVKDAKKMHIK